MKSLILCLIGVVSIIMAAFLALPVAVNFPDSWFGLLEVVLLVAGGASLIVSGMKNLRRRSVSSRDEGERL